MTNTTTPTEGTAGHHPSGILMNLIVALLAPMFLGVTAGDVGMARMAAIETIDAYQARNLADLIAVAQIIAYGLAALGSLSLSMADDISLSMTLRLRGNAVSLDRSAERSRRVLRQPPRDNPTPYHPAMTPEPEIARGDDQTPAEVFLNDAAAQILAAESQTRLERGAEQITDPVPAPATDATDPVAVEKRHRAMWAIAMVKEAGELTASIPNLPLAERSAASIRAGALGQTANELLTGRNSPNGIS
jgi:hypothetical protein